MFVSYLGFLDVVRTNAFFLFICVVGCEERYLVSNKRGCVSLVFFTKTRATFNERYSLGEANSEYFIVDIY